MDQRIYRKVKAYIEKHNMLAPGDAVVMGVSGGADSVCLFLLLCELAREIELQLMVVHVHHGIREEAEADVAYVERLCAEYKIPFELVREDVRALANREHLSEEEAGRMVRYRAFENALAKLCGVGNRNGKIAVAHNANDRAETMLFHLFRGTGLAGMGGIRPVRDGVIRPILCLERKEIESYLKERQISFCIDRTNMDDTYTRNRIRNHILPYAETEICKGAVAHMCETADILQDAEKYIRKQTSEAYKRCLEKDGEGRLSFYADMLQREDEFLRKQVLLMGLERMTQGRKDITSVHVTDILGLIEKKGSKQISLPYGLIVRKECSKESGKEYERLIFHKQETGCQKEAELMLPKVEPGIPGEYIIQGLGKVTLTLLEREKLPEESEIADFFEGKSQIIPQKSCTKWFDYDRITKSLSFRTREKGDYLTINEKMSKKSLKEYMIGEKIPKDKRDKMYVLADGSHVLWMPGYRISEYYKITLRTEHILQVQIGGEF